MEQRFEADGEFLQTIEPFITFKKDANVEAVHATVAPDLSLPDLLLQYRDISDANNPDKFSELTFNEAILKLCKTAEVEKITKNSPLYLKGLPHVLRTRLMWRVASAWLIF